VRDEGGDVFDLDLVEALPAEVGDQVLFECPAVEFECARADGSPVEPLAGVLLEGLPAGLDAFAAAAAQSERVSGGFGFVEAAVDGLPASCSG
jgi:hypothetical protein